MTGLGSADRFGRLTACGLLACGLVALALVGCSEDAPAPRAAGDGAVVALRRLTPEQYANIIADVFGPRIKVVGSFDPLIRTDGLMSVSAAKVGMTPPGFEQFDAAARAVAAQVIEDRHRATLIPCAAIATTVFDRACAQDFFSRAGRLLLRRPLTGAEVVARVALAENTTRTDGSFAAGLATGLSSLLTTPAFLYVTESVAAGPPDGNDRPQLDDFSIAARLSFLLWNTTPDDGLLADAERGVLSRPKDLARQVDRMLASPRLDRGVRAFFADMLALEKFAVLEKDTSIYPSFSQTVAQDGREQILRTITHHLLVDRADYRDLFTSRRVFLSDTLARLYKVPAPVLGGWGVYEFPEGDPRAGIQTAFATTALFSHPGRSSPTLRGRAIRENLMCQTVPDPPGDVDFTLFSKVATEVKTARQRLDLHNTEPACAGCHKLMDPVGLSLENFDGVGQLRTTDGGAPIDASGALDGVAYEDPAGLAQALRQSPAVPACLVTRLYTYGLGRSLVTDDRADVAALNETFKDAGYRMPDLLRAIAVNPRFIDAPPTPAAQLANQ